MELATINGNIAKIKTAGAKLDALIQVTAVGVAEHFRAHADTGVVNRLYLAMPKGSRGTALAQWLLMFTGTKVNTDKETKGESPFVYDKARHAALAEDDTIMGKAATTMWYDLKKEKALDEVFDVAVAVRAILRRIEKSTKVEHFDRAAMVALAQTCGIPESDVPTKAAVVAGK